MARLCGGHLHCNGLGDGATEANITITEIESNAGPGPAAAPLAKAPLLGFYERTPAGDLPKISADGRTPAEAYARPFAGAPGVPRVSLIMGGLGLNQKYTLDAINELPPEAVAFSRKLLKLPTEDLLRRMEEEEHLFSERIHAPTVVAAVNGFMKRKKR